MATFVPPKRGVAFTFWVALVSRASRPQFQANPTLAAGDVKVSKDGGALANLTTLPVVTPASSALVKVDLSATEMTADNVTVIFQDAAGAEWDDLVINIQTAARQIDDLAFPNVSGRGVDVDASGGVEVGTNLDKTGYALTTAEEDAIVDKVWDEGRTAHVADGSMGQTMALVRSGTAAAGAAGTITLDAGASATDDFYNDLVIQIIGGTGVGQARLVSDYVGATKVASITPNWVTNPDATSVFLLRPATRKDLALWLGVAPNALAAGRADVDLGAWRGTVPNILAQGRVQSHPGTATGTADSGTTTTAVDAERTEADTDYWKGAVILFTSGTLAGQARIVTAFDPATDTITFAPATTLAVATHQYILLPASRADLHLWLGSVVNALQSGRPDVDVRAVQGSNPAAVRMDRAARGIVTGTVGVGSTTTSIVTSALDPAVTVADQLKGRIVIFDKDTTTAALRGQATDITANTSGGTLTVTALTTAPASGDTFTIT